MAVGEGKCKDKDKGIGILKEVSVEAKANVRGRVLVWHFYPLLTCSSPLGDLAWLQGKLHVCIFSMGQNWVTMGQKRNSIPTGLDFFWKPSFLNCF